jgi:uncharacterized protein (AIM24 family)
MKRRITGTSIQTVELLLSQGEEVITEHGTMGWYRGEIIIDANRPDGTIEYQCLSEKAEITFTPSSPASVFEMFLEEGESLVVDSKAFVVGGGVGFAALDDSDLPLRHITGPGLAFFEVTGEARPVELGEGEVLEVSSSHLALMDTTIRYRIKLDIATRPGAAQRFLMALTGPGRVWLRSMA